MPQKYPVNKPLRVVSLTGLVLLVILFVVAVVGTLLPIKDIAIPPFIGTLFGIILMEFNGIFCFTLGTVMTKYSWSLNEDQFFEWYIDQQLFESEKKRAKAHYDFSSELFLLHSRLGGTVVLVAGIVIIIGTGFIGSVVLMNPR
jgi:hypothetical protein